MSVSEEALVRLHDDPALFREALNFTAAETGFITRLIEKDYFSTVLLQYLALAGSGLIFRGGTCLAKVHAGFYRLSEDLDFVIPTAVDATRADRRRRISVSKDAIAKIEDRLSTLRVLTALTGANNSTQYNAVIGYTSLLGPQQEFIKLEVGLQEPLLIPTIQGEAHTLLLDPVSGQPMIPTLIVPCVSREEAFSEKLRAALSRRDVAIRDFYDIDHAVRRLGLNVETRKLYTS